MGYLVYDIGGSSVKYAYAEDEGTLSDRGSIPTCGDDLDRFLYHMVHIFEKYKWRYQIGGIAVSAPGAVDSNNGIIHGMSAVPCIHEIPFSGILSEAMDGLRVTIENDGNCGVMGEYWKGAAKGRNSAAMIVCGSGIGGGYIQEGRVGRSSHFTASEFGFMPIACEDGVVHPWSDYSVVNTVKRYNRDMGTSLTGKELFELAAVDQAADGYVERFYHYMAAGCMSVAFVLDPEVIVIGGAVSKGRDFKERFQRAYLELKAVNRMFEECHSLVRVSELGNDANLYGALYHHLALDDSSIQPA